jgi:hypothetical protein
MSDIQLIQRVQRLEERVTRLECTHSRDFADINVEFTLLWNSLSDGDKHAKLERGMRMLTDEMCWAIDRIVQRQPVPAFLRTQLKTPEIFQNCMTSICERYRNAERVDVLIGAAQTLLSILKYA